MKYKIKILIFISATILFFQNILYAKSYKIVIDPGHSYKDAENFSKIGPFFTLADGITKVYGLKKGTGKDTKYTFASEPPTDEWDYVYNSKDRKPANRVGFVESAINLEVSIELARLLNADSSGFSSELTRNTHGYVMKETYDEGEDLKARARFALERNADLFLSIHFDAKKVEEKVPCFNFQLFMGEKRHKGALKIEEVNIKPYA